MKTLVTYFSRSGHTRQIAQELALRIGADIEEIQEVGKYRDGVFGYLRSGWDAVIGTLPELAPPKKPPHNYDLVVIGTPVWNFQLTPPVRAYAKQHVAEFKQVAFFCTAGGSGDKRAFEQLAQICGKQPLATLAVTEKELDPPSHAAALGSFAKQLTQA